MAKKLPYYPLPLSTHSTAYRPISPNDFAWELSVLGLAGETYTHRQYIQELERFLQIEIKVRNVSSHGYPLLQHNLTRHGLFGGLFFELDRRRAWIIVPDHLPANLALKIIYHELAHLAAGHPVRRSYVLPSDNDHEQSAVIEDAAERFLIYPPWPRLADREPPTNQAHIEQDADHRADLALKFAFWGSEYWDRPEFYLGLVDQ